MPKNLPNETGPYMKRISTIVFALALMLSSSACSTSQQKTAQESPAWTDAVYITLSDNGITVDAKPLSADTSAAVYAANDIVYYEDGHDFA